MHDILPFLGGRLINVAEKRACLTFTYHTLSESEEGGK